ncbi:MAG: hypothetical protein RL536_681 [Candidatus Parcubacteria bacterium]
MDHAVTEGMETVGGTERDNADAPGGIVPRRRKSVISLLFPKRNPAHRLRKSRILRMSSLRVTLYRASLRIVGSCGSVPKGTVSTLAIVCLVDCSPTTQTPRMSLLWN